MFEKFFQLSKKGTDFKTELLAGLTTFLTMAYILGVNPGMLSIGGVPFEAAFLATALSAAIATLVMGLYANYPVALAPGMGLNAFFTFNVIIQFGLSWQAALAAVFVSGILFLVVTVTGIRKVVIQAIPKQLKLAIGAGIGFFIAFIGFQNAGIIVANEATLVGLGSFKDGAVLLAVFGVLVTIGLLAFKVKAAVFFGMVLTAVVGLIAGSMGVVNMPELPTAVVSAQFDTSAIFAFVSGFEELFAHPQAFLIIFTFLFVDFFDTAGTLVAVANRTNLVDDQGNLENVEKALMADAVGTIAGATLGTSTVTSYIESASGVEVGGRTGLTAVTTALLFVLAIFFAPLLGIVNATVTAPALIVVGILMAQQLGGVDWNDFVYASSSFMAVITMILAYSISDGIAVGFITYVIACVAAKRTKEIHPVVWILLPIFVLHYILK